MAVFLCQIGTIGSLAKPLTIAVQTLTNKSMSKKKEEPVDEEVKNPTAADQDSTDTSEEAMDEVSSLKADLAELNDKYVRMYSEFDNYKRRTARERVEFLQSASRDLVVSLLPVLDDFERAEKAVAESNDLEALREGMKLVHHKMKSVMSQNGLQALESVGKEFDVDFHEAITKIPAPSKDLQGKVVDEVERGYLLKDKVIRFAKVVVGE